jgi:CheY-like chemotaxis protein
MKGYVIIVDDDEDARVLLSAVLTGLGLPHESASDGVEALAQIERVAPSLVLLDLMMPRMHGYDVIFRLRANPKTRDIPVVVFSAHQPSQAEFLRLPGVKQVIRKGTDTAIEQIEFIARAILDQTGLDHLGRRPAPVEVSSLASRRRGSKA